MGPFWPVLRNSGGLENPTVHQNVSTPRKHWSYPRNRKIALEVAVRDPEDCVLEYLPGFDICAGDPPAEDSCYGDSGGPLLVREGDAWAQVGVVSRGEGCAAFPGLYADATALREWILTSAGFEVAVEQVSMSFGGHALPGKRELYLALLHPTLG